MNVSVFQAEPVMLRGVIVAVVVFLLKSVGIVVEQDVVEGVVFGLIIIFGAWRARENAMPLAVINEAGFTSTELKQRAKSPGIRAATE